MVFPCRLALLLLLACVKFAGNFVSGATYNAGVVEFAADTLQPSDTPIELILRNTNRYVNIITTAAKHSVDILVFPECGLTSIAVPNVRDQIFPYLTEIPDIGVTPCDLPQAPQVLRKLSCAARSNGIYVVFNLEELVHCSPDQPGCPSDGSLFYNTNIALNRNGSIVAKYRKFNLFIEPEFNITKMPDHSWFDTDFGVRFGTFICFDIMFREPSFPLLTQNISNFVYPTAWFSELPFLTAISVQAGWAYANDVNLLAAGYSNTPNMNAGSGIYAGRDGRLMATMSEYSSTKLLIARISSDQRNVKDFPSEEIIFSEDTNTTLQFFHDNLTMFMSTLVEGKNAHLEYENEGFSCNITANFSATENGPVYRLVAFSGLRTFALIRTATIEVCGVVACTDRKLSSCSHKSSFHSSYKVFSKISISASSNKSLATHPVTLDKHLLSFHTRAFQFESHNKFGIHKMSMVTKHPVHNFISFALYRNELK